ncbi:MAG: hypothetical protein MI700_03765 [Balneolales bacterium]|nr:hypothetical protein [Balneolales bacterium]
MLNKLTYGSHGEIHFNDEVQHQNGPDGVGEFDFHKLAFFANYAIDKHWSITSKVKVEHALDSKYNWGDMWLDNLYLKYKHNEKIAVQVGMISVPLTGGKSKVYGTVELSPVEKYLAYSWREAGVAISGKFDSKLSYKATLTTGLNPAELQGKSGIFGARNYGFFSSTSNAAAGFQLKYAPLSNVYVGSSFLYSGLENSSDYEGDLSGASYRVSEVFFSYKYEKFGIRTVGVYSTVAESDKINEAFHNKIGSVQAGGLVEFSYDFSKILNIKDSERHFTAFLRGEMYDTHFKTNGITDDKKHEHIDYSLGLVYKPFAFLELKTDYQITRIDGHANNQVLNMSLGYNF